MHLVFKEFDKTSIFLNLLISSVLTGIVGGINLINSGINLLLIDKCFIR